MITSQIKQKLKLRSLPKFMGLAALACAVAVVIRGGAPSDETAIELARLDPNAMPIDLDRGTAGLSRCLAALGTRASMLMVEAHPDDEDGGLLAYQTRQVGARVALLSLTRGEGGQNAMSTDFYDALGLVRTQELLQSDRFYGVDQYWGTVIDYGFSKTREEALAKWGYDRVLSDAVRVVRMTRPLVITSVFAGAPTDGHGNHQVSGQMAQEVFLAAGDPQRFPEQIRQGLRPWKPLKVYARVPFFEPTKENTIYDYATDKYVPLRFYDYVNKTWMNQRPSIDIRVAEGGLHPQSGLTFLQIGRAGWGFQKSQNGGGTIPPPRLYSAPYHRYGSLIKTSGVEKSFYDGMDVSLAGIASLATGGNTGFLLESLTRLSQCVADATNRYRPGEPAAIAPELAEGLKQTRALLEQVRNSDLSEPGKSDIAFELERKVEQFEKALTLALNISFEAVVASEREPGGRFGGTPATFTIAVPGQRFAVRTEFLNGSSQRVGIRAVTVTASDGKNWRIAGEPLAAGYLEPEKDLALMFSVRAPHDARSVKPYFERPDEEQPYYNLTDERFRNLSTAPYPLYATARISFHDVDWELREAVQTNSRVENIGMKQEPLLVAPALSVSVTPGAGAVPLGSASFAFTCNLHSNVKGPAQGKLHVRLPRGWHSTPAEYPFAFTRDGENESFSFEIAPGNIQPKRYELCAVADYQGKSYAEGYRLTGYPGLRPYPYYRPSTYQATGVDVKTAPGIRVGFFPGTGDDVPQALANLRLQVSILSANDLQAGNLADFDAIMLGVRAYSVRPELRTANARLLSYVKNGGVLIVQYNLQNLDEDYGPYPFSLGSNVQKVVDENSAVRLLQPANPALNWPNKITEADFRGWQEERGHGFMATWDSRYQALLETHDPDQSPQRGGLLLARCGQGFYVYDAYALYRQLPSGVPGAYRILANLISLKKNPGWNESK